MILKLHIPDASNPKVSALIEFLKTLDYVSFQQESEQEHFSLSNEQINILQKASANKNNISLNDFKKQFKDKYGV